MGCIQDFSIKEIIYHIYSFSKVSSSYLISNILSILVKRVPVLSNTTDYTFPIYSKHFVFLINILFFIAKFNVIATTHGMANPRAQGQLATTVAIDFSNGIQYIQSTLDSSMRIISNNSPKVQIIKTAIAIITIPDTKYSDNFFNRIEIPSY